MQGDQLKRVSVKLGTCVPLGRKFLVIREGKQLLMLKARGGSRSIYSIEEQAVVRTGSTRSGKRQFQYSLPKFVNGLEGMNNQKSKGDHVIVTKSNSGSGASQRPKNFAKKSTGNNIRRKIQQANSATEKPTHQLLRKDSLGSSRRSRSRSPAGVSQTPLQKQRSRSRSPAGASQTPSLQKQRSRSRSPAGASQTTSLQKRSEVLKVSKVHTRDKDLTGNQLDSTPSLKQRDKRADKPPETVNSKDKRSTRCQENDSPDITGKDQPKQNDQAEGKEKAVGSSAKDVKGTKDHVDDKENHPKMGHSSKKAEEEEQTVGEEKFPSSNTAVNNNGSRLSKSSDQHKGIQASKQLQKSADHTPVNTIENNHSHSESVDVKEDQINKVKHSSSGGSSPSKDNCRQRASTPTPASPVKKSVLGKLSRKRHRSASPKVVLPTIGGKQVNAATVQNVKLNKESIKLDSTKFGKVKKLCRNAISQRKDNMVQKGTSETQSAVSDTYKPNSENIHKEDGDKILATGKPDPTKTGNAAQSPDHLAPVPKRQKLSGIKGVQQAHNLQNGSSTPRSSDSEDGLTKLMKDFQSAMSSSSHQEISKPSSRECAIKTSTRFPKKTTELSMKEKSEKTADSSTTNYSVPCNHLSELDALQTEAVSSDEDFEFSQDGKEKNLNSVTLKSASKHQENSTKLDTQDDEGGKLKPSAPMDNFLVVDEVGYTPLKQSSPSVENPDSAVISGVIITTSTDASPATSKVKKGGVRKDVDGARKNEVKEDEASKDEERKDEARKDEARKDEARKDEARKDEARKDEARKDEERKDEERKDEARKDEARKDELRKDEVRKQDVKKEEMKKKAKKESVAANDTKDFVMASFFKKLLLEKKEYSTSLQHQGKGLKRAREEIENHVEDKKAKPHAIFTSTSVQTDLHMVDQKEQSCQTQPPKPDVKHQSIQFDGHPPEIDPEEITRIVSAMLESECEEKERLKKSLEDSTKKEEKWRGMVKDLCRQLRDLRQQLEKKEDKFKKDVNTNTDTKMSALPCIISTQASQTEYGKDIGTVRFVSTPPGQRSRTENSFNSTPCGTNSITPKTDHVIVVDGKTSPVHMKVPERLQAVNLKTTKTVQVTVAEKAMTTTTSTANPFPAKVINRTILPNEDSEEVIDLTGSEDPTSVELKQTQKTVVLMKSPVVSLQNPSILSSKANTVKLVSGANTQMSLLRTTQSQQQYVPSLRSLPPEKTQPSHLSSVQGVPRSTQNRMSQNAVAPVTSVNRISTQGINQVVVSQPSATVPPPPLQPAPNVTGAVYKPVPNQLPVLRQIGNINMILQNQGQPRQDVLLTQQVMQPQGFTAQQQHQVQNTVLMEELKRGMITSYQGPILIPRTSHQSIPIRVPQAQTKPQLPLQTQKAMLEQKKEQITKQMQQALQQQNTKQGIELTNQIQAVMTQIALLDNQRVQQTQVSPGISSQGPRFHQQPTTYTTTLATIPPVGQISNQQPTQQARNVAQHKEVPATNMTSQQNSNMRMANGTWFPNTANKLPQAKVKQPMQITSNARSPPQKHPAALPILQSFSSIAKGALLPSPSIRISHSPEGVVLSWNINVTQDHPTVKKYFLYAYQVLNTPPNTSHWKRIGEVGALPPPMACTLNQFQPGSTYFLAICAVDVYERPGKFSITQEVVIPT